MMKNLLYILPLLFVLPLTGLAQNDSIITNKSEQPTTDSPDNYRDRYNNQIDIDIELFGANIRYNRKLLKNWTVGLNTGLGYIMQPVYEKALKTDKNDRYIGLELAHIGINFNYLKTNKLNFEINPRFSIDSKGDGFTPFYGIGFGVYYGKSILLGLKIKIRYPLEVVYDSDSRLLLSASFLIIRIPFKW